MMDAGNIEKVPYGRRKLLVTLLVIIYILVLLHGAAMWFFLYWTLPWFDLLTHFIGGLWLGLAGVWIIFYSGYYKNPPALTERNVLITILASVAVVGLLWEAYEFLVQVIMQVKFAPNYPIDTLMDLVMDMFGACASFLVFKVITSK